MPGAPEPAADLRRVLGFWGGTAVLVGTVIGGGIFRTPGSIAQQVQDPLLILGLWAAVGLITLCGAATLAELATLLPKTGGTYVYLRAAYGDAAAFVFGWLYLLAATPSGMGALAVFFAELGLELVGGPPTAVPWAAVGTLLLLSAVNVAGARLGAGVQKVFTALKVTALAFLIGAAFLSGRGDWANLFAGGGPVELRSLAAATAFVMFTYNGWVYIGLVAGEIADPERRLTRILFAGLSTILVLYLGANLAYVYLFPVDQMAGQVVGREALVRSVGSAGGTVMSACILASVFGALNGVILTKTRVPYALARDGLSFPVLGRCHPRFATPYVSILVQGAIAVALVLALSDPAQPRRLFDRITTYFVVVEWLALVFAIASVFVLRRRMPDAHRPYRTPGYPWVPLVFVAGTSAGLAGIVWSACARGDYSPLVGLGIVLSGFPVYALWRRKK